MERTPLLMFFELQQRKNETGGDYHKAESKWQELDKTF
jgi:hypothetical protein